MAANPLSQNSSIAQMDHEKLGGALLTQSLFWDTLRFSDFKEN